MGDFEKVTAQLPCMTALCGTPGFVEYQLIITSSDSIFVSSITSIANVTVSSFTEVIFGQIS